MDTAKVIKRQLAYCLRGAETEPQRQQVQWWIDRVDELAAKQPPAAGQLGEAGASAAVEGAPQPEHAHA